METYVDVPKYTGFGASCPHSGERWSCPPYDFDPEEIWRRSDRLDLLAMQIFTETEETRKKVLADPAAFLFPFRMALDEALREREAAEPGSLRLNAGRCRVCRTDCAREKGQPCRFPGEMRYSLESLGAAVGDLARDVLGTPVLWIREGAVPAYLLQVGGLLRKERRDA